MVVLKKTLQWSGLFFLWLCDTATSDDDGGGGAAAAVQQKIITTMEEDGEKYNRYLQEESSSFAKKKHHRRPITALSLQEQKHRHQHHDAPFTNGTSFSTAADLPPLPPFRVIGGTNAVAGDYPWFARGTKDKHSRWNGCAGSLVSREFILTAAHCIKPSFLEDSAGYEIGALCAPFDRIENCGQRLERHLAREVYVHPKFDKSTFDYDFALVRLSALVTTIKPVAMDLENTAIPNYVDGDTKIWGAGLGTTVSGDFVYPTNLLHAELSYVSQESCRGAYSTSYITGRMMCASQLGVDTCQGDSGGPLYDAERGLLVGITSWGIGCASERYPGVYARVSNRATWIKNTICNNSLNMSKPDFCSNRENTSQPTSSSINLPSASPTSIQATTRPTNLPSASPTSTQVTPRPTNLPSTSPTSAQATPRPTNNPTITPTGQYTLSPTTGPTKATLLPTLESESCSSGNTRVSVLVVTDMYPMETTWTLAESNGDVVLKNDKLVFINYAYMKSTCVSTSSCYIFTIKDSYGDGITEEEDGGGYFSVLWAGVEQSPGGLFLNEQQFYVGGSACDGLTIAPTVAPKSPTSQPTNLLECFPSQAKVTVTVHTDIYPFETAWMIENEQGKVKVLSEPFTEANLEYTKSACLYKSACYIFTIEDDFGDGILQENGGFVVEWDGQEIGINEEWTEKQKLYIGDCDGRTLWPTWAPTASVTSTPSITPQSCPEGSSRLTIVIFTDEWPDETSWQITNGEEMTVSESQGFDIPNMKYTESMCLPSTDCYNFKIMDSFGDGLYSLEGYFITWEGQRLQNENVFWKDQQITNFGASSCDRCGPGKKLFTLEIQTDSYGGETYWDLKKTNKKGKFQYYIWNGDEIADLYVDNMLHVESYCLPQKRCYRFIMSDAYGDGMCCDNGNGYYKIKYGNSVIRESNFTVTDDQFPKYEEYTARFGKCD